MTDNEAIDLSLLFRKIDVAELDGAERRFLKRLLSREPPETLIRRVTRTMAAKHFEERDAWDALSDLEREQWLAGARDMWRLMIDEAMTSQGEVATVGV